MGIGLGIILKDGNSTGGTDLMAVLLKIRFPNISVAVLLGILDGIIVFAGIFVFGIEKVCYALLCIYGIAKITDVAVEGPGISKMVLIISRRQEEISKEILQDQGRGVTKILAEGAYSQRKMSMLMCVVSKKEVSGIKEIVKKYDPSAFVIISDARETIGEGFVEFSQ